MLHHIAILFFNGPERFFFLTKSRQIVLRAPWTDFDNFWSFEKLCFWIFRKYIFKGSRCYWSSKFSVASSSRWVDSKFSKWQVYRVLFGCQCTHTLSKVLSNAVVIKRNHILPSWLQSNSIKSNSVVRIVEFLQKVESCPRRLENRKFEAHFEDFSS